jgi:hypothetical protein
VNLDYGSLKAAAIKMASAPECVQRAVIEAYTLEYGYASPPDPPRMSGMYLMMRILFQLPSDYRPVHANFSSWSHPVVMEGRRTRTWNYQWPVHANPEEHVLEIERCQGTLTGSRGHYMAIGEFHFFKTEIRFPMRSPAEIEALEIRGRP